MATIEDIQRKHTQFITSQDNIVDTISSYGVDITNDTPFQQYAEKIEETVATKLAGIIGGTVAFEITERDFVKPATDTRYAIIKYSFYRTYTLTKVTVPNFITSIGQYAFGNSKVLSEVVFKGKTQIEALAFSGCTALERFYLPSVTSVDEAPVLLDVSAFNNTTCQFIVPNEDSKDLYIADTNWNTLADRFIVEEVAE